MKPWLTVRYTKPYTFVSLTMPLGQGRYQTIAVRVDNRSIQRWLQRHGVSVEVGFSLGSIWKGVKKMAKAVGVDKVVKIAAKALPAVTRLVPPPMNLPLAATSLSLDVAKTLSKAAGLNKRGRHREAKALVTQAAIKAAKSRKALGHARTNQAVQTGRRLYQIAVTPL